MLIDPDDDDLDSVGLLNAICRHPPIEPAPGGLSYFEFVILANLIALAWRQHRQGKRSRALMAGKKAMSAELPAKGVAIDSVGREAYRAAWRKDATVPDEIEVTKSARNLLLTARFAAKGTDFDHLYKALNRLLKPIDIDGVKRRLLWDWRTLRSGKLRLVVNGRWIPRKRFTLVSLPLPTHTRSRALPLYLLLHVLDFKQAPMSRGETKRSMSFEAVCDALGISTGRWDADTRRDARRALGNAVKAVNAHLETHHKKFEETAQRYLPNRIAVEFVADRVQLIDADWDARYAQERRATDAEHAAEAMAEMGAHDDRQRKARRSIEEEGFEQSSKESAEMHRQMREHAQQMRAGRPTNEPEKCDRAARRCDYAARK